MEPSVLRLHTYFLFPFSIDKEAVMADHPGIWKESRPFFDGVDDWIAASTSAASPGLDWKRASYSRFDLESEAYQTMVFFHPFVRRVFFDVRTASGESESLVNCYEAGCSGLVYQVEDTEGRSASLPLSELRLFLFANGIGILSMGAESRHVPARDALWINEMARKAYPSSARQRREGRCPSRVAIARGDTVLVEERFESGELTGYQPPLSATLTSLLYFADYQKREYEPVLDERMVVYTYLALNRESVPAYFPESPEFQVLLSRILFVDRFGDTFRYEPEFTRASMGELLYRRWSHQGTWYGFTTYSNITVTFGEFDCDEHNLREGFLIHRMFNHRYYLMAIIALFYRATLLDFSEQNALVSKHFFDDYADGQLSVETLALTERLRSDFLHFANYWYFDEVANKDEEMEHFTMQCRIYRIESMRRETEIEIEKLSAAMVEHHQRASAEAVNRLAVSTVILGAVAVMTGYFGMNFGRAFGAVFFEPKGPDPAWHYFMIVLVSIFTLGALMFAAILIAANWREYKRILLPLHGRREEHSLRRNARPD